jgi:hypothetical protein
LMIAGLATGGRHPCTSLRTAQFPSDTSRDIAGLPKIPPGNFGPSRYLTPREAGPKVPITVPTSQAPCCD